MMHLDKLPRWIVAWFFYRLGYGIHGLGNVLIDISMKAQGIYGFKKWPWSEADLWTATKPTDGETK